MKWDKNTEENWKVKMEDADKGLILDNAEEIEQCYKNNPLPTEEEIRRILDGLN